MVNYVISHFHLFEDNRTKNYFIHHIPSYFQFESNQHVITFLVIAVEHTVKL